MAKIYSDELKATLSSGTLDMFDKEASESKTLNDAISNFVDNNKDKLSGEQYDNFRSQFEKYSEALAIRMALAASLGAAIKEAIQLLVDYIGEDTSLDSSKLDEYKQERQTCASSIETLKGMLNATHQVEKDGVMVTEKKYNSAEVSQKIALAEETLAELDRIIAKVEGLDAVYAKAESILSGAFSQIDAFKSNVSSIKPGGIYSYSIA